ncbi:hypothetical protein I3843_02G135000 [Carya illinoinensis]|nr:hypothetical protein I3843_02G135000 [Carya illinoinensis]
MLKFTSVVFVFGTVVAAVLLQSAAAKTVHVVGDSMGWTVPVDASAYENWAASKKFMVGDILTFNFVTGAHGVLQVSKESYDSCSASNPIGDPITTGPINITLSNSGNHYYICDFSMHCQFGQKLTITVLSALLFCAVPSFAE